jgi:CO/xanthine dehydrogenase Mo-binding subunit
VYTNHIPNGAFRGFGSPQVTFASESQINKLAEKLGMDPVKIRLRNVIKEGDLSAVGSPLPKGISIEKVIRACAVRAGWKQTEAGWQLETKFEGQEKTINGNLIGLGFSAGYKSFGIPPDESWATVEIHGDVSIEQVIVRFAGADMGQGAQTIYAQFAASALDVPLENIRVITADTDQTEDAGSASASRLTFMSGNSIFNASRIALEKWRQEERPAVGRYQYRPSEIKDPMDHDGINHPNFGYGYVAEAVKAVINESTGKITIQEVVCAIDVGKAINPIQVQGQIEGALMQAFGYAVLEDLKYENCRLLTNNMATYLIPTIMDIPRKIVSVILEEPDPIGPLGARGMAEMPLVSFAPALTAAIHSACHVWFDTLPLTPERILDGLEKLPRSG